MKDPSASGQRAEVTARAFSNPLLAIARISAMGLWTAGCYPCYMLRRLVAMGRVNKRLQAARWSHIWFGGGFRIMGIRAIVRGKLPEAPALLTPNHLGYLDILAVGGQCATLFVSKLEVESIPIVGLIFRHGEGIGVSRANLRAVREANKRVAARLQDGVLVCAFLEGTSSGGDTVMPFHASLIQSAIDADAPVVPMALSWRRSASTIDVPEDVAFWKDHSFAAHVWRALGLRGLAVEISFGEPIIPSGRDRKTLAVEARDRVAALLEAANEDV